MHNCTYNCWNTVVGNNKHRLIALTTSVALPLIKQRFMMALGFRASGMVRGYDLGQMGDYMSVVLKIVIAMARGRIPPQTVEYGLENG